MNIIDTTSPEAALEAINEIHNSLGWKLIAAYLDSDSLSAAVSLGASPSMETDAIHFRRGAIHANEKLKSIPAQLKIIYENKAASTMLDEAIQRK